MPPTKRSGRSARSSGVGLFLLLRSAAAINVAMMDMVQRNMLNTSILSWEYGTAAQAMLEYNYGSLGIYGSAPIPLPAGTPPPTGVTDIAAYVVANRPSNTTALFLDGSAADPASMGVAVLIANATLGSDASPGSRSNYAQAAADQLSYLLNVAPKSPDGAISHRADQVQLWSDSVFMTPPFLAYYGAVTRNSSLLQLAYDQCRLYRQALLVPSMGLWQHIVLGTNSSQDPGLWSTGNGWAAAGMLRVLLTINKSVFASQFAPQVNDLVSWVSEIVNGAMPYQQLNASALIRNYINESTFLDAAGTTLLAASTYRLASLGQGTAQLARAETYYQTLESERLNGTGWLQPVVNPNAYASQGTYSPEGQSFVLMLAAARRDYLAGNVTSSANSSQSTTPSLSAASRTLGSYLVLLGLCAAIALVCL